MTRKRSPNYPGIPLPDAVEHIVKAYPKAHTHKSDKESIAKLFGYTTLNGASLTFLGALSQYGLLEGRKDDIGISEDGETIAIEHKSSKARLEAIERCARNPSVFADTLAHFGESLPGADELIRPYLIRKGFSSSAVDGAIRSLRDTVRFVKEEKEAYNRLESEDAINEKNIKQHAEYKGETRYMQPEQPLKTTQETSNMTQDSFTLDEGQVLLQYPQNLSSSSIEFLDMWLQLQLRKAKDRAAKQAISKASKPDSLE